LAIDATRRTGTDASRRTGTDGVSPDWNLAKVRGAATGLGLARRSYPEMAIFQDTEMADSPSRALNEKTLERLRA